MKPENSLLFKQLLTGLYDTVPAKKSKNVRIFLSSTFTGESKAFIQL
jgi:hypothetical protein